MRHKTISLMSQKLRHGSHRNDERRTLVPHRPRSTAVEVGFEPTDELPHHTLSSTGNDRPPQTASGLTRAERRAVVDGARLRTGPRGRGIASVGPGHNRTAKANGRRP